MNTKEREYERISAQAAWIACGIIKTRYEKPSSRTALFFHNQHHTLGVCDRAKQIGTQLDFSPRDFLLLQLACLFHDSIQGSTIIEQKDGARLRVRWTERNERASGEEALAIVEKLKLILTSEEKNIVRSAILATVPKWSVADATVIQPFLSADSHPIARALALADLGTAGMDSAAYVAEGPRLFLEENVDIAWLSDAHLADLTEEMKGWYRKRILAFFKGQTSFAKGRQSRLWVELEGLPPDAARRVTKLFSHFETSIAASDVLYAQLNRMDFSAQMRFLRQSVS